jgi:exonuclease SbcC
MNLSDARQSIGRRLSDVSEIASGVLRGVRQRGKDVFATYVFDLNNELPSTVGNLNKYLDDIIGPQYFDENASPDLRWNNYLYFVVARPPTADNYFLVTKRQLEADRSYARKYVVFDDEFDRVLNELDSIAGADDKVSTTDVVEVWTKKLSDAGLSDVADADRPVADTIRGIASGTVKRSTRQRKESGVAVSRRLVSDNLASINLSGFRKLGRERQFDKLSKVNLLFGPNGVGKTSFLEAIEFLFCGANRRYDSGSHFSVAGSLKSGEEVQTSGTQHMSDFKTRQRLWYGNDDTSRQNNLPNQFARFNFLNTDAAAELSLLKGARASQGSNAEILADLLSGPEANLMWRRIENIRRAVSEELRNKRAESEVAHAEQQSNETQIKTLEDAPREADAEFAVLAKDLQRIGWTNLPSGKQDISAEFLDSLAELASQLSGVLQLDWMENVLTEESAVNQAQKLRLGLKELTELDARRKAKELRLKELSDLNEKIASRRTALASIEADAVNDLLGLTERLDALEEVWSQNTQQFSLLPTSDAPDGWEAAWGALSLPDALRAVESELKTFDVEITQMQRQLEEQASTQTQLQASMTQLRTLVYKMVEHRHSDKECPVCGTEFDPGELFARLEAQTASQSAVQTSKLRLEVDRRKGRMERLTASTRWLEQMARFATVALADPSSANVEAAVQAATVSLARRKELTEARQETHGRIDGYSRAGLSLNRVRELCEPIDAEVQQRTSSTDIVGAQRKIESFAIELSKELTLLEDDYRRDIDEFKLELTRLSVSPPPLLSAGIALVQNRLSNLERVVAAVEGARQYVSVQPSTRLRELLDLLSAALLRAKLVSAAIEKDLHSDTSLKLLKNKTGELEQRLTTTKGALERLGKAQKVLDDIVENDSLDAATAAVVVATHKAADGIFSRIHSPAEYRITADANAPLMKKEGNTPVSLNEVSTGQRAAYALSMFLAMNAQVEDGPKVILLDDPISHIDDLNALSFLDYLRNLVLNSNRQLFFATADEKIAGLFAHKFGFLGSEFQIIEPARAEASQAE